MKTNYEIIDIKITYDPQNATYTEIRLYRDTGPVKVVIRKNYYDHQSYAVVSSWSVTNGWLTITQHGLSDYAANSVWMTFHEANETLFANTAQHLFRIAENFLGV